MRVGTIIRNYVCVVNKSILTRGYPSANEASALLSSMASLVTPVTFPSHARDVPKCFALGARRLAAAQGE